MPIPRDAYVMVIGAMKSGTSTFFAHLTSHPRVAACRVKEPEYFSEYQGRGVTVEAYEDLWDFDPHVHRYCAEASTGYTKYPSEPHVPDLILKAGIEPRFVYLVRDPIERIESQFNHGYLRRTAWATDSFWDPELLNLSRYHMQLQQFLLRFPDKSRYWIVDFQELVMAPQHVMNRTFGWLGLEPFPVVRSQERNANPNPSRLEFLLGDIGLSGLMRMVPAPIKSRVGPWLRKRAPARRRVPDPVRKVITPYLERDVRLFGEEFGFPVEKWGF